MKPLYALAHDYQAALEACYDGADEGDGSIPQELVDALAEQEQDFAAKVEQCCRVLADMKSRHAMLEAEADMLSARAKAVNRQYDWLREYVKSQMDAIGKTRIRAGMFDVTVQNNSKPSVVIEDESQIPDSFFRTQRVLEKAGIAAILKEGGEVPGARIVCGTHLRVR